METLKHFSWNKFSIIYMDEFSTMADTLVDMAAANNMTVNHIVGVSNTEEFPTVISETKNSTRSEYYYMYLNII